MTPNTRIAVRQVAAKGRVSRHELQQIELEFPDARTVWARLPSGPARDRARALVRWIKARDRDVTLGVPPDRGVTYR